MAIKKFTPKAAKNKTAPKPLEFELYDEKFSAVPALQGTVLLSFMEATAGAEPDDEASNAGLVREVMPFFESALYPESFERFITLTKSHDKIVEFDDLMDILSWLIEEYTSRPTPGSDK